MNVTLALTSARRTCNALVRLVDENPDNDIWSNFRIEGRSRTVTISAAANQQAAAATVRLADASAASDGCALLPARLFTGLLSSLAGDAVNIAVDGRHASVTSDGYRAEMHLVSAEKYPSLPHQKHIDPAIHLRTRDLATALRQVLFAAAGSRGGALHGVRVRRNGAELQIAATDGMRLASTALGVATTEDDPIDALIPASALRGLQSLLSGQDTESLQLTIDGSWLLCLCGDLAFSARRMQDALHDGLLRAGVGAPRTQARVDRVVLLDAVERAALLAETEHQSITLKLGNRGIRLESERDPLGSSAEDIAADIRGPEVAVCVTGSYIQDVCRALDAQALLVSVERPDSPVSIRAAEDDTYQYIVAPRLRAT